MKNKVCDKGLSFQDCELAILRTVVDKAEEKIGKASVNSPEIKRMIEIVENFIRRKKLIVYGGTAINNILPKSDQFYNKDVELSDYDFFSTDALGDAKELADIYVKEGFLEVEAKSGQHHGTYKVFVNFLGMADITYIHKDIYNALKNDCVKVNGILYAPPNFLRMSMYLELSRPAGDVGRWEKVLKRLTLLNKNYPLKGTHCSDMDFQRDLVTKNDQEKIYKTVRDSFIQQGVVFFGSYAISLYSQYMPKSLRKQLERVPDFDVLSEEPDKTANILKERLEDDGFKNIKIVEKQAIGDIIAPHYQILVGKDTIAFIYKPIACHSYNIINIDGHPLKIATIDTMLSFYLAFLYSGRDYFNTDRIICMSQFLFDVQQENRLKQSGLLKRFSINCYGHQETVEEMRAEKSEKHKELKGKRDDPEFEEWFLRYRPSDKMNVENKSIQKKDKKRNKDNKYKLSRQSSTDSSRSPAPSDFVNTGRSKLYKKTYSYKKTSSNNKTKKNKMMKRIFGKRFTKGVKGKERGRGGLFV